MNQPDPRGFPDPKRPNEIVPVRHNCGSAGDADEYWVIYRCFKCGVRPSAEFRLINESLA